MPQFNNILCILFQTLFILSTVSIYIENALIKESLPNTQESAKCLDGTVATFYRSNIDNDALEIRNVLIYLAPGGFCHDIETCKKRCRLAPFLCTSPTKTEMKDLPGILSDDDSANPSFAGYYKILLPYCTGDMFIGQRLDTSGDTEGFTFQGRPFIQQVITRMVDMGPLQRAERLILAGSSAGGARVVFNCDFVAGLVPHSTTYCVVDAAFFYPIYFKLHPDPECESIDTVLQSGALFWNAPELESFRLHNNWWERINQRLFIASAVIDQFGFQSYCGDRYNTYDLKLWQDGAKKMANDIHNNHPNTSLFIPSCFDHMLLIDKDAYNKVRVGIAAMTLAETLKVWLESDHGIHVMDSCIGLACNPNCPNNVLRYSELQSLHHES